MHQNVRPTVEPVTRNPVLAHATVVIGDADNRTLENCDVRSPSMARALGSTLTGSIEAGKRARNRGIDGIRPSTTTVHNLVSNII